MAQEWPENGRTDEEPDARRESIVKRMGHVLTLALNFVLGNEITNWALDTRSIDPAFLIGRHRISRETRELFLSLPARDATATLAAFRGLLGRAWLQLEPMPYNVLIVAYQFLSEFVKMDGVFRAHPRPGDWLLHSLKMQRFFAELIAYPEYAGVLLEDCGELIKHSEKYSADLPAINRTMEFIVKHEHGRPGIQEGIIALYVLARNKMVDWDRICKEIKVRQPALDGYRAPKDVLTQIKSRLAYLKDEYRKKNLRIRKIEKLKNGLLQFDAEGNLRTEFVDAMLVDRLRRNTGKGEFSSARIADTREAPHRLLPVLLEDLNKNCLPLLTGIVAVQEESGRTREVLIFAQNTLKTQIDLFDRLAPRTDLFFKKYRHIEYTFGDLERDFENSPDDPIRQEFLILVDESRRFFRVLLNAFEKVLFNHGRAVELAHSPKPPAGLERARDIPIESLEIGARFIPGAEGVIVSSTRFSGETVLAALNELHRMLINYLYLYREPEIRGLVTARPALESRIKEIGRELRRMGVAESAPGVN